MSKNNRFVIGGLIMKVLQWNNYTRKLENSDRIILGNRLNGKWLKISRECYEILELAIAQQWTDSILYDHLADEEDRGYFKNLLSHLYSAELIVESQPVVDLQIDIVITHRCNLSCIHCCVDANSLNEREYFDTKAMKTILKNVADCNPKTICLTGGEPLVRDDFEELLIYLGSIYSGDIRLMTNGTLISEKNVELISKYVSAVDISIDGVDEESCSKIRGKGVFDKVIHAVKLLQEQGLTELSLSMVLTKDNYPLRKKFIDLNNELGTFAAPRIFSPIGRGKNNSTELMPELDVLKEYEQSKLENISLENLHMCCCGALIKNYYIEYTGDILPCGLLTDQRYSIGNIMDINDLERYILQSEYKKQPGYKNWLKLQPENQEHCKDCNVNLFCWHCLHDLDLAIDSLESQHFDCSQIHGILNNLLWGDKNAN